ncbi:hypothetical protein B0H11DRAFT_2190035 [Mycena galericulata]|nr:hypothetical protein B0H11DRAFT_2190035 [Mycena galericulata]
MIRFGYSFGAPGTVAETYCFGPPETVPGSFVIGNRFGVADTFCLWTAETAPETISFRSSFGSGETAPETEDFGRPETAPESKVPYPGKTYVGPICEGTAISPPGSFPSAIRLLGFSFGAPESLLVYLFTRLINGRTGISWAVPRVCLVTSVFRVGPGLKARGLGRAWVGENLRLDPTIGLQAGSGRAQA